MKTLKIGLRLLVAVVALLVVPAAAAQEVLPPENAAVNQYTEPLPTAGGTKDAHDPRGQRRPAAVLGPRNARELERRGTAGRAVAELVAETAPPAPAPRSRSGGEDPYAGPPSESAAGGADGDGRDRRAGAVSPPNRTIEATGPSGVGAIVSQALGGGGPGDPGNLLIVAIALVALWAIAYATRHGRASP